MDVVFPLLHGPFGEDGTLQGLLELADIRYVGAGVLASAVGMDKHFMKVVFEAAGLRWDPTLPSRTGSGAATRNLCASAWTCSATRVFVKPARAGSSMGISRVDSPR